LVASQEFEWGIAAVIILNVLTMASEHYNPTHGFTKFIEFSNYVFTLIFVVESSLKYISYGLWRFHFGTFSAWNNFDLFIVFVSAAGIYFDHSGTTLPVSPAVLRILRILRVMRILKLLKSAKDLMVVPPSLPLLSSMPGDLQGTHSFLPSFPPSLPLVLHVVCCCGRCSSKQ